MTSPFRVDRIDHVEVFVRDLEASFQWYQEVLGLQEFHRFHPFPLMIGAGETMIALFPAQANRANNSDDENHPVIRWRRVAWQTNAEGFETALLHLKSLGVEFRGPIGHDIARSIYFSDPDGNPLEITYYLGSMGAIRDGDREVPGTVPSADLT